MTLQRRVTRPRPRWTTAGRRLLLPACLVVACALDGCALTVAPPPSALFHDALFAPASERIDAAAVFAVSASMRDYVHARMPRESRSQGRRDGLVQALSARGSLQLDYDATRTRTAAEAFDARAGNCLSLVIMTAALAWDLDVEVRFQAAVVDETWSRQGDLMVGAGHVNITLVGRKAEQRLGVSEAPLTIDFMPQEVLPGMRIRVIDQATVLAMFMNNRAVEAMAAGRLDDAYAYASEAVRRQPGFATAYNTLGVVYQRHGNPDEAGAAYRAALDRDPGDPRALANLSELRSRQGDAVDATLHSDAPARPGPDVPDGAAGLVRLRDHAAAR